MEAVLTMTPRSPSSPGASFAMAAAARRIMLKVPTRLMLMALAKVSRRCGPSRPTTFSEGAMPAQLTSACRWPKALSARSTAACASLLAGDVGEGEADGRAQFGGQGFARGAIGVGDDDRAAFSDEQPRCGRAQSRCAAGDKEDVIR